MHWFSLSGAIPFDQLGVFLSLRYHSAGELPADFLSGLWLAKANNYRLLCEPIDIANYYRPWAIDR